MSLGSSPLTRGKLDCRGEALPQWRLIPAHAGKTSATMPSAPRRQAHPRSRGENPLYGTGSAGWNGSSPLTRGKRSGEKCAALLRRLIPAHAGKTSLRGSPGAGYRAHPRSRGENDMPSLCPSRTWGSSPLTRGKLQGPRGLPAQVWLIPAHAGKTDMRGIGWLESGAHPRSRGENEAAIQAGADTAGSSPLTRGKPDRHVINARVHGLIPAHAGKTRSTPRPRLCPEAHPRSRGENTPSSKETTEATGSSPLTRGKPMMSSISLWPVGLIPAHAGKTRGQDRQGSASVAHPRSRGENQPRLGAFSSETGSSPLTRGKRADPVGRKRCPGLIPAHAGKTKRPPETPTKKGAHPRSRGENPGGHEYRHTWQGSSPLTRGKRCRASCPFARSGLIPAHAGKTLQRSPRHDHQRAHPRSRGENTRRPRRSARAAGSSPLTRGKPPVVTESKDGHRLIPAHAGKTHDVRGEQNQLGAHPRSRGENPRPRETYTCQLGSSPLTRGKPGPAAVIAPPPGLIPAHAGKTQAGTPEALPGRAHPRSRGENAIFGVSSAKQLGSSPLTRGKRSASRSIVRSRRLIPAHAGKTGNLLCAIALAAAHPRSRGENEAERAFGAVHDGSSPLTRGKLRDKNRRPCNDRLIPAHAGKTF